MQPNEPITLRGTNTPMDSEKGASVRGKAERDYNFKQIIGLKCVPGLKLSSIFSLFDFPIKKQEGNGYIRISPLCW